MARPDSRYLVRAAWMTAREAVWAFTCRHEQGAEPNILLFATRRGGSTFAMETIGANRGVRPMNQPLETQSRNLTMAQALEIPRFRQGQIASLDEHDAAGLERLVTRIFAGEVVINAPTQFWRRGFEWRSDRVVLKLTDCKPVIDWFDRTFDARIVYLTRHPIPQALSCIRNQWTLTVDAHLGDPRFVEQHLSDDTLAVAHDVMRGGDDVRRFVLNWVLENVAPLRLLPRRPAWLHVRYEDCVTDPDGTIDLLADRLALGDVDRMRVLSTRPSQSSRRSTDSTRQAIEAGHGAHTVTRWRRHVDADLERWCHDLLERFEVDPEPVTGPSTRCAP